jgi:hypothetical protein
MRSRLRSTAAKKISFKVARLIGLTDTAMLF